ncbi:hypothetical protein [Dysgonomonas sp. HGC4]|uniref:hypothetical protein n=1 Tax=Dysgonomonas sp. HGC4 TaxID=1658009 RepID=UPI00067FFB8E|nr:hypothetical protein [Dysgonomonas sp. HGC4]MBD8349278.1 hypothetical protein [Dysgonomonas sp. HGC4]
MPETLHTPAFNLESALTTGVDPRTGKYDCNINLVTLKPYNIEGPERPLILSFSVLEAGYKGFGRNWHLKTTQLDLSRGIFTSMTGVKYEVEKDLNGRPIYPSSGEYINLKDLKVQNIRIKRNSKNQFEVFNKDGIREILTCNEDFRIATIRSLIYENGEIFDFKYNTDSIPLLEEITHRQTRIKQIHFIIEGSQTVAYNYPTINGNAKVNLIYGKPSQQGTPIMLLNLSYPFLNDTKPEGSPKYTFDYERINLSGLNNSLDSIQIVMTHFAKGEGAFETISYNPQGIQVTNNQWLPTVYQHTTNDGDGQPSITKEYYFMESLNYTGFSLCGSIPDKPAINDLLQTTLDYTYWTWETLLDNNGKHAIHIEREYNQFHLLITEITKTDFGLKVKRIDYNQIPGNFFEQPANLHFPRTITQTYNSISSGKRTETEHMETDNQGNILSSIDINGIERSYTYYPTLGIKGLCPADPLGFVRFVRELKIIAPSNKASTTPKRVIRYTYTSLSNPHVQNHIVKETETVNEKVETKYLYVENNNLPLFNTGRLRQEVYTIISGETQDQSLKKYTHKYNSSKHEIVTTLRNIGFNGEETTVISIDSLHKEKVLPLTKRSGITQAVLYNLSDQVTHKSSPYPLGNSKPTYNYTFPLRVSLSR